MRLLSVAVVLCGFSSPALAECETGTPGCNPDVFIHPLPGDASGDADDPSLYADPALAPSEDDGEVLAPTHEQEDTPDIDPGVLTMPPE
jgi:hypothetical protein